jgi:hypothetical protein
MSTDSICIPSRITFSVNSTFGYDISDPLPFPDAARAALSGCAVTLAAR